MQLRLGVRRRKICIKSIIDGRMGRNRRLKRRKRRKNVIYIDFLNSF